MNKRRLAIVAIATVLILLLLVFLPLRELYQHYKVAEAINAVETNIHDGIPSNPSYGGIVKCMNGEWIVVSLHHGTWGFTLAYTSKKDKYLENDAHPHPAIEVWDSIIRGPTSNGYRSIDDFFKVNNNINWIKISS